MKFFEKMMALLLSLAAVLSFAMPAFAEDTTTAPEGRHTITIRFEKPDHEYKAYQVFKGDYFEDADGGHLSTISWGSGVDGETLLAALKDDTNAGLATDFENANTAEEVADILAGYGDDRAKLDAFAKLVGAHLTDVVAGTSTQSTAKDDAGQYVYTIPVTGDGYYFVKDSKTLSAGADDANTKYILQVLNDVEIHAKADVPDIDKKITGVDGTDQGKQGSYNVGDTIYFALTSKVPAMDGYTSYTYKVTDTLSSGLTLVQKNGSPDVTVTIKGDTYTAFTASLDADDNILTIDFTDFIRQKGNAGKDIVIRYSAVLNENALQKDKETNTVNLEYSNDPNTTGTGKTTDKKTYVYNFDIDIVKVDQNDKTKQLNGAEFVLYHEDTQGKKEYYHYTADKKTEWVPLSDDKLETVTAAAKARTITAKTTVNGQTSFTGLKAGTYYLLEIKAPDGYSLPTAPVEVVITAAYDANGAIDEEHSNVTINGTDHMFVNPVITNKPGPVLPSTGGIGTTIFYVLGGILTVAAIVLLIVKKRMENTKR